MPTLADLFAAQHHVVSRQQALARGFTDSGIAAQVRAGRWQRLHQGIYSTRTGPATPSARQWAALLAGGAGAVLSHETAGALYGLPLADRRVHICVPARRRVDAPAGVVVHRSRRLAESRHPGLVPPRTRLEVTVVDLVAGAVRGDAALGWAAAACQHRLTTAARLRAELTGRPTVPWRGLLLEALADIAAGAHSPLELHYLRRVERAHGLPTGRRQRAAVRAGRREWTDVLYEAYAVVIELDGRLGHDEPEEGWRDSRRDNATVLAGEVPLRYGWADVTGRPCNLAGEVAALLAARGWSGRPRKCGRSCTLYSAGLRHTSAGRSAASWPGDAAPAEAASGWARGDLNPHILSDTRT